MRNTTIRTIAILLSLAACGTDHRDACTEATRYMGSRVPCDEGAGICIAYGPRLECVPLCQLPSEGPYCGTDEWPTSIAVADEAPICFCEPAPMEHVQQ